MVLTTNKEEIEIAAFTIRSKKGSRLFFIYLFIYL